MPQGFLPLVLRVPICSLQKPELRRYHEQNSSAPFSPAPESLDSPSAPSHSKTLHQGSESPQPTSALPLPKWGPKTPPASPHLLCACSHPLPPHTTRHRPQAVPKKPLWRRQAEHGRSWQAAADAGSWIRDCPHLPGASQLHAPASQHGGYQGRLLKGCLPTGRV